VDPPGARENDCLRRVFRRRPIQRRTLRGLQRRRPPAWDFQGLAAVGDSSEVKELLDKGITPVFVPDDDPDHQGSVYDKEEEEVSQ
jgi:hypothetical protein